MPIGKVAKVHQDIEISPYRQALHSEASNRNLEFFPDDYDSSERSRRLSSAPHVGSLKEPVLNNVQRKAFQHSSHEASDLKHDLGGSVPYAISTDFNRKVVDMIDENKEESASFEDSSRVELLYLFLMSDSLKKVEDMLPRLVKIAPEIFSKSRLLGYTPIEYILFSRPEYFECITEVTTNIAPQWFSR